MTGASLLLLFEPALAQIKVVAPAELASEFRGTHGFVYGTTAAFGAPYYGERILGRLAYAESRGRKHCDAADYDLTAAAQANRTEQAKLDAELTGRLASILLIKRGECSIVTKTRVAQDEGAQAVIIVDDRRSGIQKILTADADNGTEARIPTVLIGHKDGQKLIKALEQDEVILQLAWGIPRSQVVVADFWMSSGSVDSNYFLERFKGSAEALRYHLQFVPRYHIFSMPKTVDSAGLCIEDNAYCAPDPDGPGPVTGADVVQEDLRQWCIWQVTAISELGYPASAKYSQEFWDYVVRFFRQCPLAGAGDRGFTSACAARVMAKLLGASQQAVERCEVTQSRAFLEEQVEHAAWSAHGLRLNGWPYNGPLDPDTVLRAVCAGYIARPPECRKLIHGANSGTTLSFATLCWSLAIATCTMVVAFFVYRRRMAKSVASTIHHEVEMEVQSQMTDYLPLQDINGRAPLAL